MPVEIRHGDCVEMLATLEPESFHACVTDPPYHLTTDKKGGTGLASLNVNSPAVRARISTGFMGKTWDGGDVAFRPETWAAVYRVLKPGAHLLAFGGTRTFHRLVCAIEDAGFEIRDTIMWLYGSGFPKSLDVSKQLDRMAGVEREIVGQRDRYLDGRARQNLGNTGGEFLGLANGIADITAPATEAARAWQGWGTALKPACEPIVVARKPLSESTVAGNVLRHGTGALNIDASRVATVPRTTHAVGNKRTKQCNPYLGTNTADHRQDEQLMVIGETVEGPTSRWPANVAHDGSPEVLDVFAKFGESFPHHSGHVRRGGNHFGGEMLDGREVSAPTDAGTAARFFKECPPDAPEGRWPANVAHDGSPEVLDAFAKFGERTSGAAITGNEQSIPNTDALPFGYKRVSGHAFNDTGTAARFFKECPPDQVETRGKRPGGFADIGAAKGDPVPNGPMYADSGSASRFFYTAKAGANERCDSKHPTVKPVALMEWLVRLVTPPGGQVLDPFCGTGSTLVACDRLGFDAVGIEQDAQTAADAHEKLKRMRARRMIGDAEKRAEMPGQLELGL